MTGFTEIGDRCWVARHDWFDVNVGLVEGERGLVVIDTHASDLAAREVIDDLRAVSAAPVLAVVNTHAHLDHTFGNATFAAQFPGADLIAHEGAVAEFAAAAAAGKATFGNDPRDPRAAEIIDVRTHPPATSFSSVHLLDLGDRAVELVHPGRGHTGGDLVAAVPDSEVAFAGDLVEQSARSQGAPAYGADSYPLDWPTTLDVLLGLIGPEATVVPGHGTPVTRAFVEDQRAAIGIVAETIRDLAGRGVPLDQAVDAAEWPYPRERLLQACRRGYEQLPRHARGLPLI